MFSRLFPVPRSPFPVFLVAAVLLAAASWAAYAQVRQPVNPNEPIVMTKGMYADLLCLAASDFDLYRGGVQFTYEPASDTIRAEYLPPTRSDPGTNAQALSIYKNQAKERAERKAVRVVSKLQRHVSPTAACAPVNF